MTFNITVGLRVHLHDPRVGPETQVGQNVAYPCYLGFTLWSVVGLSVVW